MGEATVVDVVASVAVEVEVATQLPMRPLSDAADGSRLANTRRLSTRTRLSAPRTSKQQASTHCDTT